MLSDDDAITDHETLAAMKVLNGLAGAWRDPRNSGAIATVSELIVRTFWSQGRKPETPGDGAKQEVTSAAAVATRAFRQYVPIDPRFRI
jgi:hypothetical protein